ncbi:hypothetical protein OVY01_21780 [Robbsia sp. Bb-Pol-6]|uniref:Group 4 capsule polysaccharide lipoprotein gfcB, YjbF n=1 Tax=Robbsia betulipollinis TaxID=2981849 RepID=A0ABT3ZT83_9BURK|nr:hypothetical protein [Robbsia betulipollinis]MCY0389776.1 hypothetical protein [Robbsia betulipollinis]
MLIPRLLLIIAPCFLTACSTPMYALNDYVHFKKQTTTAAVAKTPLNPAFQYLLVTIGGKSFLMARGGVENAPDGPVELWYSGSREVIRMQNGRIVAASGTPIEWSDVSLSAQPAWEDVTGPSRIERRRDVMPGYRFGLKDALTVAPVAAPSRTAFYGKLPGDLHWFTEVSAGPYALPTSRYAVRFDGSRTEVIYGEQCLAESFCFSWQRWPNRT